MEASMDKKLLWGIFLAAALGLTGVWFAIAQQNAGAPFVKGGGPVTEDQVRQEMLAEGYSNPQIMREGRYFEAMGTKDGQTQKLVVDSQTGRLRDAGNEAEDND
jgi:hypothetical protein